MSAAADDHNRSTTTYDYEEDSDYERESDQDDDVSVVVDHATVAEHPRATDARIVTVELGGATRSRESSVAAAPQRRVRLVVPEYVYASRLIAQRQDVRFIVAMARVSIRVSLDAVRQGSAAPRIRHRIEMDARHRNDVENGRRRLVVMSVRVHEQDARAMPIDVALRLLDAPRPYVVQRNRFATAIDAELVTDGVAYMNDPCRIVFGTLDAVDFDMSALADASGCTTRMSAPTFDVGAFADASGGTTRVPAPTAEDDLSLVGVADDGEAVPRSSYVLVPKCYRYAALLRQVAMAQEHASLEPLMQQCATATSLACAPLSTSDSWLYTDSRVLVRAANFVQRRLLPPTRRLLDIRRPRFAAEPLDASRSWSAALAPYCRQSSSQREFGAQVQFVVHLASIPVNVADV